MGGPPVGGAARWESVWEARPMAIVADRYAGCTRQGVPCTHFLPALRTGKVIELAPTPQRGVFKPSADQ